MEVLLAVVACGGFISIVLTVYVVSHSIAERDRALLGKIMELFHSHMPVGEPISILNKKLDLQFAKEQEIARNNEFKRARIKAQTEQLNGLDPEQD